MPEITKETFFNAKTHDYDGFLPIGVRMPEITIDEKTYKNLGLDNSISNYDFLRNLCLDGVKKLGIDKLKNKNKYYERIKYELDTIKELGFVDYFLIVWDIIKYAKNNNIPCGAGRGSAAGSCVLYVIGVTGIDPIKYNLFFERFISKQRAKPKDVINGITFFDGGLMPDVDSDFSYDKRHKILEYINKKYKGKTCKILNISTLATKACLKESCKIIGGYSEEEANKISDMAETIHGIPRPLFLESEDEKKQGIYQSNEKFREWADKNPKIFDTAKKLIGLNKNYSVHASGIVISYYPVEDIMPLQNTKEGELISGYDMSSVAEISLKFDALGLQTLGVLDDVAKSTGIDLDSINTESEEIYQFFQNEDFNRLGIFQIEADTNYRVAQKVKPKNISELSSVIAIARPGALSYLDDYAKFTNTGEKQSVHQFFDEILDYTGGLPLFQEQLMGMINKVGFSLEDAEDVRRCVTGDTRFFSKTRGWIKIETLIKEGYKDDLFLVMSLDGEQEWKKISDIWSNGKKQIRYVEAKNGMTVKASMYHQFATDSYWKARFRLNENDYLITTNKIGSFGKKTISDDLAIIMAGIVSGGYYDYSNCTFTNYEKNIIDVFYNSCLNLFGEKEFVLRDCGKVISIKKKCADYLSNYMKRGKSAHKDLPEIIFSQDKETIKKFISFYFACEGTVCEKELSVTSKSRKLIQKMQLLLTQFNIRSFLNIKNNKKYGEYYICHISGAESRENIIRFKNNFSEFLQDYKLKKLNTYINSSKIEVNSDDLIPNKIRDKFLNQYPDIPFKLNKASGRIYSDSCNLSRKIFNTFCKESRDDYWINFSKGKHFYSKFKSQEKDIREVEVFDFTIDEETPYIIANGILIHNCVGKKKVHEMPEWKKKIFDKCKILEDGENIAKSLWKVANESANYSFNASHAFSYANLSALTTYVKIHYPKEFYCALLKMTANKQKPQEEISLIAQEMNNSGFKLLPPNLLKSEMDFSVEKDGVRYGLLHIKKISEKSMEKLEKFRNKNSDNKIELFLAAKDAGLNIGALSSLIQAGTLNEYDDSRCRLVLEAQTFNILTEREKKFILQFSKEYNYDVLNIISDFKKKEKKMSDNKFFMSERRFETFKKNYEKFKKIYEQNKKQERFTNWFFENELLGYSYKYKLKECFNKTERFSDIVKLKNLKDASVKIIGKALSVQKKNAKSSGNPMLQISLSDETGSIMCFFMDNKREKKLTNFLESFEKPEKDDILMIDGNVSDSGSAVFINKIFVIQSKVLMSMKDLKV